jgi:hypothetical protein
VSRYIEEKDSRGIILSGPVQHRKIKCIVRKEKLVKGYVSEGSRRKRRRAHGEVHGGSLASGIWLFTARSRTSSDDSRADDILLRAAIIFPTIRRDKGLCTKIPTVISGFLRKVARRL